MEFRPQKHTDSKSILAFIVLILSLKANANQCSQLFYDGNESSPKVSSQQHREGLRIIKSVINDYHWFESSLDLPTKNIDNIYFEMAWRLGGRIIIGGSDLSEILLGTGQKVATGEINILVAANHWKSIDGPLAKSETPTILSSDIYTLLNGNLTGLLNYYRNHHNSYNFTFEVTHRTEFGRRFMTPDMVLNIGELNNELLAYKQSAEKGFNLTHRHPNHMMPLKSDYLIEVEYSESTGKSARVYFRTEDSKNRYTRKILALPDENQIPNDWHTKVSKNTLNYILGYNLIIATRGKKSGWTLSDRAKSLLATWIRYYNQESSNPLSTSFLPEWNDAYWALQGLHRSDFDEMMKFIVDSK